MTFINEWMRRQLCFSRQVGCYSRQVNEMDAIIPDKQSTNSCALLYLINKVLIQGRLMRWMLFLQEYEFNFLYKPEKHHHGADFLSHNVEGEHEKSIRDEPMDAKLFQVEYSHDEDPKWMDIRKGNTSERKAFILKTLKFTIIDQVVYRLGRDGIIHCCQCSKSSRQQVIHEVHIDYWGGDFVADITLNKILQVELWWEKMTLDVTTYCKKCDICQQASKPTAIDMIPRTNTVPLKAFMKWGLDFVGPFKNVTHRRNKYIIVAIDYVTKWAKAKALLDNTAKSAAWFLYDNVIPHFGCPLEIVSD